MSRDKRRQRKGSMGSSTAKPTAMRAIFFMGITAFILLGLTAAGLKPLLMRDESQRARGKRMALSPFDGERAFADLKDIAALGPRPSGSAALETLRQKIIGELNRIGLETRTHAFTAKTPVGDKPMVNVVGVVKGTKRGVIVLGNHYESKQFEDFAFIGVNDGGSSAAWMLEMARTLGPKREGRSIWLVFFDGEEAFGKWSDTNGLFGSRAFVQHLIKRRELNEIHLMINVDMIGDCYLGVQQDTAAPRWMTAAVWNKARELGYEGHFLRNGRAIVDDHIPFRDAGVPAMDLIDFQYGGTRIDHQRNWHTANDTLDRCCAQSLQVVGDVVYQALPELEAALDSGRR